MKWNRAAVEVAEAQRRLLERVVPLGAQRVPLLQSFSRTLAADVAATHPVPHFVKSGMDGYAVRHADILGACLEQPVVLRVNQVIACGAVPTQSVEAREAARIMTGAMLPEGADTVVPFELTEECWAGKSRTDEAGEERDGRDGRDGRVLADGFKNVRILQVVSKGRNTSAVGEEMADGDKLMERGRVIAAGEAALLATFGYETVSVVRKPRVAILTTGSELLPVEAPLQPGKIRNSNRYLLAALVESAGGELVALDTVPDDVRRAEAFLQDMMSRVDLVITTGGVSVGDFDIMADLLERWGGDMLFNKVEMRPGSVTSAGVRGDVLLCALSGNPSACFVGFELFVRPVIHALLGRSEVLPATFTARLQGDYAKGNIYPRYLRARTCIQDGLLLVEPVEKNQSSVTVTIKDADCLVLIPPGGGARAGDLVTVLRLS
jgi:molybdopterin molybdotransferase